MTDPVPADRQQRPPRRTRVAVVFGGRSTEHQISCVSAGSVLRALNPQHFDVVPDHLVGDIMKQYAD